MSDKEETEEAASEKPSPVKTLLFSGVSALVLGGAAAGVVFLAPSKNAGCAPAPTTGAEAKKQTKSYEDIAFVNLEPLIVTLGPNAQSEYLKISISLETTHDNVKKVEHLRPKFRDVLNAYLRAVDEKDLIEPFAMTRLRAQMLRRMQVVASSGTVTDVLITDFVLN